MNLKVGDILRCKKEYTSKTSSYSMICYVGKKYIVSDTSYGDSTYCIREVNDVNRHTWIRDPHNADVLRNDTQNYGNWYEYFETKFDRAKRIIYGYKSR